MRVLFLGFYHQPNDPRLFHREMKVLKQSFEDVEIFFLSRSGLFDFKDCFDGGSPPPFNLKQNAPVHKNMIAHSIYKKLRSSFLGKMFEFVEMMYDDVKRSFSEFLAIIRWRSDISRINPKVIQASDVRELHWAVLLRFLVGSRIVYDVHEDFFNQIYEYSGKSKFAFLKALASEVKEVFLLQFVHAVFCTDDYLFEKYSRLVGARKMVGLLRSFPLVTDDFPRVLTFGQKDTLDLVYVGSVNQYRGVLECAEYAAEFNRRFNSDRKLTFTVYSKPHPIIDALLKQNLIRHIASLDYMDLVKELIKYDVGICLLHRIKKFERNLPLKNFDYMSVGLPIITSNFGNLMKYADESGAAICIDPLSYAEFEAAVLRLFEPLERKKLSESGTRFTTRKASFYQEARDYVNVLLS
jgi:glycosyltransferase involved in cell wall biosynthesis